MSSANNKNIKIIILLLMLPLLLATFFFVAVLCFEVSELLLYTKSGHNVYIAQKRAMVTKSKRNSNIKKEKYFDQF